MTAQNELTRVQIPVLLHIMALGYEFLPLKNAKFNEYNINEELFYQSVKRLNPNKDEKDIQSILYELCSKLDNEDIGEDFLKQIVEGSSFKIIDWNNFENNDFKICIELPFTHKGEEFRPDITILINGLPLVFIEVKKPNNQGGIGIEYERIKKRFAKPHFRRFANLVQLMIFSNNMGYEGKYNGAFYATSGYQDIYFHKFVEEQLLPDPMISTIDEVTLLKQLGQSKLLESEEYHTNKNPNNPTQALCTSLLTKSRLAFVLKYAIAYIKDYYGIQKHIMRYPQLFASLAILKHLETGHQKGIIWHTQGSGKTALAFYSTRILEDYFTKKGIIPKFYFIVDRLDLLEQAQKEFNKRGLMTHTILTRDEFIKDICSSQSMYNNEGKTEIVLVNIQRFKDNAEKILRNDYNLSVRQVYFLDEVHRSYNPKGSFLSSLENSDKQAVKIGLTGTPLLKQRENNADTKGLFGPYIHKYYYNQSIHDGYTLRLMRDPIETTFIQRLNSTIRTLRVQKGSIGTDALYAHPNYAEPMLEYILKDFEEFRQRNDDKSLGAMVICHSSEQAKQMQTLFKAKPKSSHQYAVTTSALILHDEGDKQQRKEWVAQFKAGNIDILFVYNMLLTGFDAPRLKKLYLGRIIKAHNLLQALTRVNRSYKDYQYGYLVDFANIQTEFDRTNQAYYNELISEYGANIHFIQDILLNPEEIREKIQNIKDILFEYSLHNAEIFSQQLSELRIDQIETVRKINAALQDAVHLHNILKHSDTEEGEKLKSLLDFEKMLLLKRYAQDRLSNLNGQLRTDEHSLKLLTRLLESGEFLFHSQGESELKLADEYKEKRQNIARDFNKNFDPQDPEFTTLQIEFDHLLKNEEIYLKQGINTSQLTSQIEQIDVLSKKSMN